MRVIFECEFLDVTIHHIQKKEDDGLRIFKKFRFLMEVNKALVNRIV